MWPTLRSPCKIGHMWPTRRSPCKIEHMWPTHRSPCKIGHMWPTLRSPCKIGHFCWVTYLTLITFQSCTQKWPISMNSYCLALRLLDLYVAGSTVTHVSPFQKPCRRFPRVPENKHAHGALSFCLSESVSDQWRDQESPLEDPRATGPPVGTGWL